MRTSRGWISGLIVGLATVAGCNDSKSQLCETESGSGCAPMDQRVDLYEPIFTAPTQVTNALFPISSLASVVFVGVVDGKPFRTETTLLPDTRVIEWDGHRVETLQSQYMAFSDGRIEEIAIDSYAQDEAGAVWYFGEEVSDYNEEGVAYTHEGTWRVGQDGAPVAMIMPNAPKAGDAWLSENIAPIAWEEVTVVSVDVTLDGPSGPVTGAVIGSELHLDGEREEKIFAPGYGEFSTGSIETDNLEALALAIPTDRLTGPPPAELDTTATATAEIFDAAGAADWTAAGDALARLTTAWDAYRTGQVPPLLEDELTRLLTDLTTAVTAQDAGLTRHQAIAAARPVYDLRLRHLPPSEIDAVRLDLWLAQVLVDVAAEASGPVRGDAVTLEMVWDRFGHTLDASLAASIEAGLTQLRAAADAGDLATAATIAGDLRTTLAGKGW